MLARPPYPEAQTFHGRLARAGGAGAAGSLSTDA